MAKKGLFGLFGSKDKKEKDVGAEKKYQEMKSSSSSPEAVKAAAMKEQVERVREMKDKPVIRKYVVVSGDTLSGIAKKYYDDAGKYMVIYEANKALIGDNPDLIQVGMELVIPDL
jgi:nucleoid-associated protein YgaU